MNSSTTTLPQLIDAIDNYLFEPVENGSDDDLFIASYLHGHFSVVAAAIDTHYPCSLSAMDQRMQQSLDDAFAQGELSPEDAQKVSVLWENIMTKFQR